MSDDINAELKALLEGDYARIAIETAISICKDNKASAAARASAASTILRAGGFMDKRESEKPGISYADMTPQQLDAAYTKVIASIAKLQCSDESEGDGTAEGGNSIWN